MSARYTIAALGLVAGALSASPALAQGPALPPIPDQVYATPGSVAGYSLEERENWLADCRARMGGNDDGVGGPVIGGLIGGVAGNRISGRGNRTVGTVVGAGVGAVAGAAIDRAEDRSEARDFCEDYLGRYEASFPSAGESYQGASYGARGQYGAPGYSYYAGRVMWVPVKIAGCGCDCEPKERVVEELVD